MLDRLKKIEMPHPLIIIFAIVILSAALTHIIPGGKYDRVENPSTRAMVVVAGSYREIPNKPQGLFEIALVPFNGMKEAADIIILLFIIGGSFSIIKDTGALSAGIYRVTKIMKGKEFIMIPILMTLFALGGGIFGMYEEVLPFVGLIVPIAIAMGYDSIVGVSIVYLATTLGFCGAFFNPFTVGVAQGIAGLPLFSGAGYRIIVWASMLTVGIIYVLIYAARIKKNPRLSECYKADEETRKKYLSDTEQELHPLTMRHVAVLIILATGFIILPVGVMKYKWYMKELTGLFFTMGIISGIVSGMGLNKTILSFLAGAGEMINAAFLIGIARGVMILLQDGQVMDTILHSLSCAVSVFPKIIAVQIMFLSQCILNCFIQSGSAQAAISMPIMAPLADILGITRQTAVLAFQMGDGFTNFAIPWNGITLAVLTIGFVPIWAWFKWAWKLQAWLILLCMLLLLWPVFSHWGPF